MLGGYEIGKAAIGELLEEAQEISAPILIQPSYGYWVDRKIYPISGIKGIKGIRKLRGISNVILLAYQLFRSIILGNRLLATFISRSPRNPYSNFSRIFGLSIHR